MNWIKKRNLILLVFLVLLTFVGAPISAALGDDDLSDKIIRDVIENNLPGAIVGVAYKGELVYLEAFGEADDFSNVKMDVDETAIQVGSLSRVFTSYALVQLLETHNIPQETKIDSFLPDSLKEKDSFKALTFQDVLMQTTGIPSLKANTAVLKSPYEDQVLFGSESIDFLSKYKHTQVIDSGRYVMTSNVNSIIAGVLIESISGKSFEEYMADEIYKPLKMRNTADMLQGQFKTGSHAINYNIFGGVLSPARDFTAKFVASDDLITTGYDLAQFLLSDTPSKDALLSTKIQNTAGFVGKSMGFSVMQFKGQEIYLQDGGIPGANARMVFVPEKELAMFLYYNVDVLEAKDAIMNTVLDHYLSLVESTYSTEAYNHQSLINFEGIYIPLSTTTETEERLTHLIHQIKVYPNENELIIDGVSYTPLSETVFYNADKLQIAEFKAGDDGKLSHLVIGNQVYKHVSVIKSFFIQAAILGLALFFNLIALLIIFSKWSSMKLHRIQDTPRVVLLLHTALMTLLMTMICLVSVRYNYWDIIFDKASILFYIKVTGILTGISIIPTFFVLKRVKEDFRWSAVMRFIFNTQWLFSIVLIMWLLHYNLI